jgi:hypothetical protein
MQRVRVRILSKAMDRKDQARMVLEEKTAVGGKG